MGHSVPWTVRGLELSMELSSNSIFVKSNLEDISPFCGATDIPVLDFW